MNVLVANFHTYDPLDHTMFRCRTVSPVFMDRDGEHAPVTCSRARDHIDLGSEVHRAIRYVGEPPRPQDIYWAD